MPTAGSLLVKSLLPPEAQRHYDPNMVLDKSGVARLMSLCIRHGGDQAHEAIQNLSNLFFHTATVNGFSTPLTDYENTSAERSVLLQEFSDKVNEISNNPKLSRQQRNALVDQVSADYVARSQGLNLSHMVQSGSTAGLMALTGARGNPMQLGQGTFSPMMSVDIEGTPIPLPIRRSFAEGLSPAEHMAMSYGGRAATIKAQMATSEPGALFKKIIPAAFHEVITMHDCKTKHGIDVPVSDRKRVLGMVEAGTDRVITDGYYRDLLDSKRKMVTVRNPQTCEAPEGICQKCYGYDSRGNFPPIGENVGTIGVQSISEGLTQAVISSKHQGGTAGSGVKRTAGTLEAARNLLTIPENFLDEATLATLPGKVTKIEKTPLGDTHVWVGDQSHFVDRHHEVLVKHGDEVYAGQQISDGTPNPKQLVSLRGLGAGRKYLAEKMRSIYGSGYDPRHFDVIARNMAKYVTVKDPGDSDFLPGDVVHVNAIQHLLEEDSRVVPIERASGKVLARRVGEVMAGTKLDPYHILELHKKGVTEVPVSSSGMVVEPMATGVKQSKLLDPNWISRLASSNLKSSIIEAAAMAHESPTHSTDPITPYILGKSFGEGDNGRY